MASYQYVYVMKQLGKSYPGGKQVLKDIWLSFYPGVKIGVIGLNGAGKSTLLKIMAGMEKEFTGEAWAAEGTRSGIYRRSRSSIEGRATMNGWWRRKRR
jgi:ATPase subunit of ABC transporter with duplicated ATPase domains